MAGADPPSSPGVPASGRTPATRSQEDGGETRSFDPAELLARLWRQNLPALQARVNALEGAAHESAQGRLDSATRASACDLAHKLAGSLGMFGYPRGTEIAREIEEALESDVAPHPELLRRLTTELRAILPL